MWLDGPCFALHARILNVTKAHAGREREARMNFERKSKQPGNVLGGGTKSRTVSEGVRYEIPTGSAQSVVPVLVFMG